MNTLPQDILFGEIARRASRVSRRFLARTCWEYLRTLPKFCPGPVSSAENTPYKYLAEVPDKYKRLPVNCTPYRKTSVLLAAAKLGYFPDSFYRDRKTVRQHIVNSNVSDCVFRAMVLATKHANTTILHILWCECPKYMRGFPALAIARGHYSLLRDMVAFNAAVFGNDAGHLSLPGVFERMLLDDAKDLFSEQMIIQFAGCGMTLEHMRLIISARIPFDANPVCVVLAKHKKWDIFDYILGQTAGVLSTKTVIEIGLTGGYDYLAEHYPHLQTGINPSEYLSSEHVKDAPEELLDRLFREGLAASDLNDVVNVCHKSARLNELLFSHIRELPVGVYTLDRARVDYRYTRKLFEAGVLPAWNATADVRREYLKMLRDYHWPLNVFGLAGYVRTMPNPALVAYLKRIMLGVAPGDLVTQERTELVKTAYVLDDLELLHLIIGESVKYPHSACRALPADSKIRAWRVANGLPCKPAGK